MKQTIKDWVSGAKFLIVFMVGLCLFGACSCYHESTDSTNQETAVTSAIDLAPPVRSVAGNLTEDQITEASSRAQDTYAVMVTDIDVEFYGLYCNALEAMGFTDVVLSGSVGFKAYTESGDYATVCAFSDGVIVCQIGPSERIDEDYPTDDYA